MFMSLRQLIICLMGVNMVSSLDYTERYVVMCQNIPSDTTQDNFSYLWSKAILHEIDKYTFLALCPIILILQIITIIIFFQNQKLTKKPGNIFFGVLLFEFVMNLHYLTSAIYYTVFSLNEPMPDSFVMFCTINALASTFGEILHLIFLFLFPVYIVYILRFTLKQKSMIWKVIYTLSFFVAGFITIWLWYFKLLGLNIFGLCGLSFIRQPSKSLLTPIALGVIVVIFFISGFFSIHYFKKHMPNTIGLRIKKYRQNKLLVYYVFGYSLYLIAYLIIIIVQLINCDRTNPIPELLIFISICNVLRLTQFVFLFYILSKNQHFVHSFKKFWKKTFTKSQSKNLHDLTQSESKSVSFVKHEEQDNVGMFFLNIKEENDRIDMLKISQVVSIVSGIYIAYKQYYNLKEEYFHSCINEEQKVSAQSLYVQNPHKALHIKSTKKIHYYEKMTTLINYEIIKDYIMDISLLPQLGILSCTMTIHAPKIFQSLLENDRIQNIYRSFELHENTKKMFALVEGQGGRSGEFFFFSYDNKYVLKTITINEFNFLEENLFYFHEHYKRNPESLLAKVYGLFTFKGNEMQRTYHLILMKNILGCSKQQIIRTYDLKGSKHDREVNIGDSMQNELSSLTLKDIDFMKMEGQLYVNNEYKIKIREIMSKDTMFLKNLNLIDYSFLIIKVKWHHQPRDPNFWGQYQRIPSNNIGQMDTYYHLGIIDYLQAWDLQKKGEKWWKNLLGKKDISAQEPKKYQQRFISFITEITEQFSFRNYELQLGSFNEGHKRGKQLLRFDDETFSENMQKLKNFNIRKKKSTTEKQAITNTQKDEKEQEQQEMENRLQQHKTKQQVKQKRESYKSNFTFYKDESKSISNKQNNQREKDEHKGRDEQIENKQEQEMIIQNGSQLQDSPKKLSLDDHQQQIKQQDKII